MGKIDVMARAYKSSFKGSGFQPSYEDEFVLVVGCRTCIRGFTSQGNSEPCGLDCCHRNRWDDEDSLVHEYEGEEYPKYYKYYTYPLWKPRRRYMYKLKNFIKEEDFKL